MWKLDLKKFIPDNEADQLLNYCEGKAYADKLHNRTTWPKIHMLVHISLGSGLRISEIADLKVKHVFASKKEPYLVVAKGKGGKSRAVFIDKKLAKHLKEHVKDFQLQSDSHVLTSSHNGRYSRQALWKHFKKACRESGIGPSYHPHCGRHSWASKLYRSSKDIRLVQELAGHSSPAVTALYSHLVPVEASEAVNKAFE